MSDEHRLTKIEVQKFLVGFLPPLIDMADSVEVVREAVSWLVSADPGAMQAWALLHHTHEQLRKLREQTTRDMVSFHEREMKD